VKRWRRVPPLYRSASWESVAWTSWNFEHSRESIENRYRFSIRLQDRAVLHCGRSVYNFPRELHDSLFWGIPGLLHIPREVNPKDKAYQRAYKAFRERLVKARTDAAMTQGEVNERMGKPHSFMSKCELGERRVDFVELQMLSKIYAKSLSFFVTEE
jgi:hypothetical protein